MSEESVSKGKKRLQNSNNKFMEKNLRKKIFKEDFQKGWDSPLNS
jgi:hypothetical protein